MIRKLKFSKKKNISILVKEYHKNEKICYIVKVRYILIRAT